MYRDSPNKLVDGLTTLLPVLLIIRYFLPAAMVWHILSLIILQKLSITINPDFVGEHIFRSPRKGDAFGLLSLIFQPGTATNSPSNLSCTYLQGSLKVYQLPMPSSFINNLRATCAQPAPTCANREVNIYIGVTNTLQRNKNFTRYLQKS